VLGTVNTVSRRVGLLRLLPVNRPVGIMVERLANLRPGSQNRVVIDGVEVRKVVRRVLREGVNRVEVKEAGMLVGKINDSNFEREKGYFERWYFKR